MTQRDVARPPDPLVIYGLIGPLSGPTVVVVPEYGIAVLALAGSSMGLLLAVAAISPATARIRAKRAVGVLVGISTITVLALGIFVLRAGGGGTNSLVTGGLVGSGGGLAIVSWALLADRRPRLARALVTLLAAALVIGGMLLGSAVLDVLSGGADAARAASAGLALLTVLGLYAALRVWSRGGLRAPAVDASLG